MKTCEKCPLRWISPLQCALTKNAPASPLQSALAKSQDLNRDYSLDEVTGVRYLDGPVEGDIMHVTETMKGHIGFLCIDKQSEGKIAKRPIGTCFFVGKHNHERSVSFGYLITAKHVWAEFKDRRRAYVRLNKTVTKPGESGVVYIPVPGGKWIFHSDSSVDLAVLPWSADTAPRNYSFSYTEFGEIAKTEEDMKKEGFSWPPKEGEEVIHIGLLPQYSGRQRNFPVVRRGHVALVTPELIQGHYGLSNYLLIDLQCYPGHSGGPVWVIYATQTTGVTAFIMGVLVGGYPVKQEDLSVKKSSESKVEYFGLGISAVVPLSKLIEIIDSPEMQEKRKKDEPKPAKFTIIPSASQSGRSGESQS